MNTHDEPQSSHLSDGVDDETIACLHALINADCHFTISGIVPLVVTLYLYFSITSL